MIGPVPEPPYTGGMASFIITMLESKPLKEIDVENLNTYYSRDYYGRVFSRLFLSIRFFIRLSFRLLFSRYNLVHIHSSADRSFFEKSLMLLLCRLRGLPAVLHIHSGGFPEFFEKTTWKKYVSFALNQAKAVIVVSRSSKMFFEKICRSGLYLLPNCVHPRFFEARRRGNGVAEILYVGHIDPRKGIYDLFRAVKILRSRGYNNPVTLVGGEKFPGAVQAAHRFLADMGIVEVDLMGEVSPEGMVEIYRRAGIFVLPSHMEGLPIALLEAMASGLPVVACAVGGIPDVVKDGINGFLVLPDDPEALAERIMLLVKNPELSHRMGEKGRQLVLENHHAERIGARLVELYREAAGERGK